MKKKEPGLWSNCAFLMKFTWRTNKQIFFYKIPQILRNIVSPFIPIVFVPLILNEITIGRNMRQLLLYVALLAGATFIADAAGALLNYFTQRQMDLTVKKIKNHLGTVVMEMPYSDAEQPKIRDFIVLAQNGTNFSQVLDQAANIITSVVTIAGLAAIIITVQPLIFIFVALVVLFRLLADKQGRKLWDKWRPKYAPVMRKNRYLFRIMKTIDFGKEIRINSLEDWIYDKTDEVAEVYLRMAGKHNAEIQRCNILSSAASILQECAVYVILAYRVVFHGMSIGEFSMYSTSVSTFSNSVSSIVGAISSMMQTGMFVRDFRQCIEIAERSRRSNAEGLSAAKIDDVVLEFRNVSFKYPNTDRFILKNINLTLQKNTSLFHCRGQRCRQNDAD